MKFAPLIFAIEVILFCNFPVHLGLFRKHLMGVQVFPNPDKLPIILNCNVNRQAALLQSSSPHQGPPAHHHCVELTVSADEHGVVDKGQGREQRRQGESNRSRSQHLTLFSLVSLLSFVFSPQLNFLFRCLSSLFAHSQHPHLPSTPPPFLYYPISQKPRNFPFSSSHCPLLKAGIVILVWPLILFPNIKQNMV